MSCEECGKIQNETFDKNIPTSPPIAYIRIENANVAIIGCDKHLKILIKKVLGNKIKFDK